jgi:hypothetical protein
MARIAAWKLGSSSVAFVLGTTIHLYNVTEAEFLSNQRWVKHELKHIEQFEEHGYFTFIWKYLVESIRKGYYNNKYEVEARAAEHL